MNKDLLLSVVSLVLIIVFVRWIWSKYDSFVPSKEVCKKCKKVLPHHRAFSIKENNAGMCEECGGHKVTWI